MDKRDKLAAKVLMIFLGGIFLSSLICAFVLIFIEYNMQSIGLIFAGIILLITSLYTFVFIKKDRKKNYFSRLLRLKIKYSLIVFIIFSIILIIIGLLLSLSLPF